VQLQYLAYGSNLHPVRLRKRIPSAVLAGTVELSDRALSFSKRSRDGSGKCTIALTDSAKSVFGAIYEMDAQEKPLLDRIEGVDAGYDVRWEELRVNGIQSRVFVYVAANNYVNEHLIPYRWYKDLVLAGARYHRFPVEYIDMLEAVAAAEDPDEQRQKANEAILADLNK